MLIVRFDRRVANNRENSDFTTHLQNKSHSIIPVLAPIPRRETAREGRVEVSVSFDAKLTTAPEVATSASFLVYDLTDSDLMAAASERFDIIVPFVNAIVWAGRERIRWLRSIGRCFKIGTSKRSIQQGNRTCFPAMREIVAQFCSGSLGK